MTDPVICADGITYERTAILEWLQYNQVSPITRRYINGSHVIPNIALRNTILAHQTVTESTTTAPPFIPSPLTVTAQTYAVAGADYLHVKFTPPAVGTRQPIAFIAILDNSGSMAESAGAAEGTEAANFTRLDLVKHAVRTISAVLEAQDTLALVTFSTSARVILAPTPMTAEGRTRISTALDQVNPDSSTNIWEGIRLAAQLANTSAMAGKHIVGMLLTDGQSTINPPRGLLPTLHSAINMTNPWSLHTFGIGYNLDSPLLEAISVWGHGLYGFIPDCSMVGTVFINFLASMLSVCVPNVSFTYTAGGDSTTKVDIGSVCLGQSRDVVIRCTAPTAVTYDTQVIVPSRAATAPEYAHAHYEYQDALVAAIRLSEIAPSSRAQDILMQFESSHTDTSNPDIKAMLLDVQSPDSNQGQIGMAPAYFSKWGEHYMRSYLRAQNLQMCMNFKDPGLQIYGGALFHEIQTQADNLFCTLPPPKASGGRGGASAAAGAAAAPLTSMGIFHNASGGCFNADNTIRMGDNTYKRIADVRTGELVWTPCGPTTVRCTVECRTKGRSQPMSQVGNLSITPWHPILHEGGWVFPANVAGYTSRLVNVVHNFVLDGGHVVDVEGIQCVTLGHNLTLPIVAHAYFGSERIVDDLARRPGWDAGHVIYEDLKTIKDPSTGMIVGWVDAP